MKTIENSKKQLHRKKKYSSELYLKNVLRNMYMYRKKKKTSRVYIPFLKKVQRDRMGVCSGKISQDPPNRRLISTGVVAAPAAKTSRARRLFFFFLFFFWRVFSFSQLFVDLTTRLSHPFQYFSPAVRRKLNLKRKKRVLFS